VASQAAKATVRTALKKVFSVTNVLVVASICFTIIEFNNGRKTINELE